MGMGGVTFTLPLPQSPNPGFDGNRVYLFSAIFSEEGYVKVSAASRDKIDGKTWYPLIL